MCYFETTMLSDGLKNNLRRIAPLRNCRALKHRRSAFVTAIFVVTICSGVAADWGTELDAIIAMPGAVVTVGKDRDGNETRTIRHPGGVTYFQSVRNGRVETWANDDLGKAVICYFGILHSVRRTTQRCDGLASNSFKADLDHSIESVENFIVKNSMPPMTKEQIRADLKKHDDIFEANISQFGLKSYCESKDAQIVAKTFSQKMEGKLQDLTSDILAIPRPPVLNPCM